jgi:hypothetical protein
MKEIEINGISYPVHFGLSTIKNFAIANGMKTIEQFEEFANTLTDGDLESLSKLSQLLLSGIQRGCELKAVECDLDADAVLDLSLEAPDTFQELTGMLMKSFQRDIPVKQTKKKTKPK